MANDTVKLNGGAEVSRERFDVVHEKIRTLPGIVLQNIRRHCEDSDTALTDRSLAALGSCDLLRDGDIPYDVQNIILTFVVAGNNGTFVKPAPVAV